MSTSDTANDAHRAACYKTPDCKFDYCVDRKEQCFVTPDCNYDFCIKPSDYQAMTAMDTHHTNDEKIRGAGKQDPVAI